MADLSKRLYVLKSNTDVLASVLNYNFSFLYDHLSAIATDRVLITSLSQSSVLADNVAASLLYDNPEFFDNIVAALQSSPAFYTTLMTHINSSSAFFDELVNAMEDDDTFLDSLTDTFIERNPEFTLIIADELGQDTRGINERTDVHGVTSTGDIVYDESVHTGTLGGHIGYLATDIGTIRTKKSDHASVIAADYSTNPIYDIEGDFWVVDINPDASTFITYRYDTEADYLSIHGTPSKSQYLAGDTGYIGSLYKSIQFLDTIYCLTNDIGNNDKTTSEIYYYGKDGYTKTSTLPANFIAIDTISFVITEASANERFTFKTYNRDYSDNGFATNVALAMAANDTLVYEIGKRVLQDQSFTTAIAQNIQKVRISIDTEILGSGIATGYYYDNVLGISASGFLLDDYTVRYGLTPRLMDDGSGNMAVVNEPWIVGQIQAYPYLPTSGADATIVNTGIDTSGGCYLIIDEDRALGVGHAICTQLSGSKSVNYARAVQNGIGNTTIYLTNDNYALPVINTWAKLGWTVPTSGAEARFLDTIDDDCNFDINIYEKNDYSDKIYNSLGNEYQLNDLRSFWYYTNEQGKIFVELKNNYINNLGNVNKYKINIYGYRLIDRDIIYTPGNLPHDHVVGFDLTSQATGSATVFSVSPWTYISNTTRVFNNGVVLLRGSIGDPSSGDYYESSSSQITFYTAPTAGEWLTIDFNRQP